MSFTCANCSEKVSDSKMAGLVIGQVASATLSSKGIQTRSDLTSSLSKGEFTAGVISGLGIKCPKCNGTNWN